MTDSPDAAVQIAREALAPLGVGSHSDDSYARAVVAALARAGWLHDPAERRRWHEAALAVAARKAALEAEVAALRAVADAAEEVLRTLNASDFPAYVNGSEELAAAVDALPPADAPAPPQGEDVERLREMAKVIDEVIAHYHQYNELDVP